MLVFHPEPHLQLVTGFVGRISDHGCHTQIPERVTVVLADEGLEFDMVVGFDFQVVAVVAFFSQRMVQSSWMRSPCAAPLEFWSGMVG